MEHKGHYRAYFSFSMFTFKLIETLELHNSRGILHRKLVLCNHVGTLETFIVIIFNSCILRTTDAFWVHQLLDSFQCFKNYKNIFKNNAVLIIFCVKNLTYSRLYKMPTTSYINSDICLIFCWLDRNILHLKLTRLYKCTNVIINLNSFFQNT